MAQLNTKPNKARMIIIAYPFVLLFLSSLINYLVLEIGTFEVTLPSNSQLGAMIVAGVLLVINHSILMTTTELTRVKFGMFATPEEWKESGKSRQDVTEMGIQELERHHNAHRNSTENSCYFLALAIPFLLVSAPLLTTYIWLLGFSLSRLGHTFAYLHGLDNLRGVFMSTGLISMYGVVSYLLISWAS